MAESRSADKNFIKLKDGPSRSASSPFDELLELAPKPPPKRPRHYQSWREFSHFAYLATLVLLDIAMVAAGFLAAYWIRSQLPFGGQFIPYSRDSYLTILFTSVAAVMLAFWQRKLYRLSRGFSKIDEFYRICAATVIGIIVAIAFNSIWLGPNFQYSRQILIYAIACIILFTTLARFIFGFVAAQLRKRGNSQVRLIIVGTGDPTQRIIRKVSEAPELGYYILGVVGDVYSGDPRYNPDAFLDVPLLGQLDALPDLIRYYQADQIIIAITGAAQSHLLEVVDLCNDAPVNIKIYPDAFQLITTNEVTIGELTGLPLVSVKDVTLRGINRLVKRAMDIVISLIILILASPFMLLIAFLIKVSEPRSPVFYVQERVGRDNEIIPTLKFRSMRMGAENIAAGWTTKNDPRRTRLGKFLRRYSLDEFPQFINVLLGHMSIVGPRPEQPQYVEQFSQTIPRYLRRHKEKVGITGWAQVNGLRGDTSIEERTRYDLYYVENWSVLFDLKIILKTIIVVFTDKNAY